jgi:hypothetical protein
VKKPRLDKINIARPSVRSDKRLDIGDGALLELVDAQRVIDGVGKGVCGALAIGKAVKEL